MYATLVQKNSVAREMNQHMQYAQIINIFMPQKIFHVLFLIFLKIDSFDNCIPHLTLPCRSHLNPKD